MINIVALPCLCVDVFDGTDIIRPGGEELNFAMHAARFKEVNVKLIGAVGDDIYGKTILESMASHGISADYVRVCSEYMTANNRTYLTEGGDRYYKEDSWNGEILERLELTNRDAEVIRQADIVFTHFLSSCFQRVIELKREIGFLLAVDFDVYRDFKDMEKYVSDIDFFMISGEESLLHYFHDFSKHNPGLFNMSLGEKGSVTYYRGAEYRIAAERVEEVVDTTGCGDSYHAGFVCSYALDKDILLAMKMGTRFATETLGTYGGF